MVAAEEGRFELVVSDRLLEEVRDVLGRPKMRRYLPEGAVMTYLDRLRFAAALVSDPEPDVFIGATPDPDDDYLVALATASGAGLIVSGDRHLLDLGAIRDGEGRVIARVLTPRELVEELRRRL